MFFVFLSLFFMSFCLKYVFMSKKKLYVFLSKICLYVKKKPGRISRLAQAYIKNI